MEFVRQKPAKVLRFVVDSVYLQSKKPYLAIINETLGF